MRSNFSPLLIAVAVLMSGCAGTTPIKDLVLPPVTTIEGTITQVGDKGFTLADRSGSIFVRAQLPDDRTLGVSPGDSVRVYGNLQGGPERVFDGYVIRKTTGEQIIVSNPAPHFGVIIQSAFQ